MATMTGRRGRWEARVDIPLSRESDAHEPAPGIGQLAMAISPRAADFSATSRADAGRTGPSFVTIIRKTSTRADWVSMAKKKKKNKSGRPRRHFVQEGPDVEAYVEQAKLL